MSLPEMGEKMYAFLSVIVHAAFFVLDEERKIP